MGKIFKLVMILIPLLVSIACSTANSWSYQLEGASENWKLYVDIAPVKDGGFGEAVGAEVAFIGKLEKLNDKKVQDIRYEVSFRYTGSHGGGVEPDFTKENPKQIFVDFPGNELDTPKEGMSVEELKAWYHSAVFNITWKDETVEHEEEIKLNVVEPK